jgi:hypothetical protein
MYMKKETDGTLILAGLCQRIKTANAAPGRLTAAGVGGLAAD